MHALGIETGAELRGQTLDFLRNHFGKAGGWYFEIARGRDGLRVQGGAAEARRGKSNKINKAAANASEAHCRTPNPLIGETYLDRIAKASFPLDQRTIDPPLLFLYQIIADFIV
jgi:nucleotidyltransferase/DNA polymerase involved in DNA repair